MVVAAIAAVVAVVATTVAWRAGRRARRAADLVSQLLDPPVVEAPVVDASVAAPASGPVADAETEALFVADDLAADPIATPVSAMTAPAVAFEAVDEVPTDFPTDPPTGPPADLPPDMVFAPAPPLAARPDPDDDPPTPGAEGTDPAPVRIPVLDLDRLRSWLTLGDVNLGRLAVVSVELDNLAFVQERLGYAAGAHLLEAITQRLRTVTRPRDVVAHVNRERFVLVCRDVPDRRRGGSARRAHRDGRRPSVGGARGRRRGDRQHRGRTRRPPRRAARERAAARDQGREPRAVRSAAPASRSATRPRPRRSPKASSRLAIARDELRPALPPDRELRHRPGGGLRSARALGPPRARPAAARASSCPVPSRPGSSCRSARGRSSRRVARWRPGTTAQARR